MFNPGEYAGTTKTMARNLSRPWIKERSIMRAQSIGRRMAPKELEDVVQKHAAYLVGKAGGMRALLSHTNLTSMNISRRVMIEADFSGADLTGANLVQSVFDGAIFFSALLRNCDARFTSFKGADMRGVTLKGANFSGANMEFADLRSAAMLRMGARGTLSRVVAESEDTVRGVDFSDCHLNGANFSNANLVGASFRNAILSNVLLEGALLTDSCLEGAILTGVDLANLPFSAEDMRGCLMDPGERAWSEKDKILDMLALHERWAASNGKSGSSAALEGADLRVVHGSFRGRRLTALAATKTIAVGVDFGECQLQGADFENSDLRCADFSGADLRGANFRNANLMHAKLAGANFSALPLVGGGVQPTILDGTKMAASELMR